MLICDAERIRSALQKGEIQRALLIRASRLGDLLFTLPVLRGFQAQYEGVETSLLTNAYCKDLLADLKLSGSLISFGGTEKELAGREGAELAKSNDMGPFDLVLALRPRPELRQFAEALGAPYYFPNEAQDDTNRHEHVVLQCWNRIRALGLHGEPGKIQLPVDEARVRRWRQRLSSDGKPLVIAHPGCDETVRLRHFLRRKKTQRRLWPRGHWIEALAAIERELGARVYLSAGSTLEARWVERLRRDCERPYEILKGLPLDDYAAALAAADLVVSVDTGPLHLAVAVGSKTIGLYGPSPASYTGPWEPGSASPRQTRVLQEDFPCAPCQGKGVRCPRNVCMEANEAQGLLESARELLAQR